MYNAKEILTLIRRRLREPTAARWTDAELIDDAHQALIEIVGLLRNANEGGARWFSRQRSFDTTADTGTYRLPYDCVTLDKVAIRQSSVDYPLRPVVWTDRWTREQSAGSFGANEWSGYSVTNNFLELWPIPTSVEAIKLTYTAVPPALSMGTFSQTAYSGGKQYATIKFSTPTSWARMSNAYQGIMFQMLTGPRQNYLAVCLSNKETGSAVFSGFGATVSTAAYAVVPGVPMEAGPLIIHGGAMKSSYKTRDLQMIGAFEAVYEKELARTRAALIPRTRTHPEQVTGHRVDISFDSF